MIEVQNEEAMSVGVVTDESNGGSSRATSRPFVRGVDADRDAVIICCRVAISVGDGLIYVSGDTN